MLPVLYISLTECLHSLALADLPKVVEIVHAEEERASTSTRRRCGRGPCCMACSTWSVLLGVHALTHPLAALLAALQERTDETPDASSACSNRPTEAIYTPSSFN